MVAENTEPASVSEHFCSLLYGSGFPRGFNDEVDRSPTIVKYRLDHIIGIWVNNYTSPVFLCESTSF